MTERRSDGVSGNGGSGGNIGGRFGRDGMRFGLNGKGMGWNMVHDTGDVYSVCVCVLPILKKMKEMRAPTPSKK